MSDHATVLFDGECNLCDAAVQFITANDPAGHFSFAALGSAAAAAALEPFGRTPATFASIVLIDADGVHERSDAALRIARGLRRPWCRLSVLARLPASVRDPAYDWIARNRYRWFGRRCALPGDQPRVLP